MQKTFSILTTRYDKKLYVEMVKYKQKNKKTHKRKIGKLLKVVRMFQNIIDEDIEEEDIKTNTEKSKKSINLKKPITTVVGGQTRTEYESQIPGLPPVFTIEKDEVVEVTFEQFKALYERGEIDTPEDIAESLVIK